MPTYVYEVVEGEDGCPTCNLSFEVSHSMKEAGPEACPRCGARIRRRLTAVGITGRHNEKRILSDDNIKRHGFKKLVNEGDGKFRVTP